DPFRGPRAFHFLFNSRERLKRDCALCSEVNVLSFQADNRRSSGITLVEHKHARLRVSPKLHRETRQENRLARTRWPDDQRVANIAHMRHEPKRCRSLSLRD